LKKKARNIYKWLKNENECSYDQLTQFYIDFVDKETCNKYNEKMPSNPLNHKIAFTWSNKPCYNR
jgi:hypothetical protein